MTSDELFSFLFRFDTQDQFSRNYINLGYNKSNKFKKKLLNILLNNILKLKNLNTYK